VLLLLAFAVAADSTTPLPRVEPVSRTTLIVSDIEAALELFRDTLGLTVRRDLVLDGDAVNRIMGTNEQRMRIVILQSGETTIGNIALLTYLVDTAGSPHTHDATLDIGEVVLVMETDSLDSIHAAVRDRGYTVVSPPVVLFPKPDMIEQRKEMMFIGPDGIAVNLIQPGRSKPAE